MPRFLRALAVFGIWVALLGRPDAVLGADETGLERLAPEFQAEVRPLLQRFCYQCHAGDQPEAELDLTAFATLADVRRAPPVWQKIGEMLDSRQMPPKDAPQPTDTELARLRNWVQEYLTGEARALAGDPGRVVLRRLSNAEYTHTLRDLTQVPSLDPARDFPQDSAAGEGFTNTGSALVMSPALVTKFLDAAKEVADHAVLLPDGIRFSPYATRRDWTDESLARIREFYRQFTDPLGEKLEVAGTGVVSNEGGQIPLARYLAATLDERPALTLGAKSIAVVARERGLNAKYLGLLWAMLNDGQPSLVLDSLRAKWRAGTITAGDVEVWQKSLWRFTTVGHIGKVDGPRAWMEPANPITARRDFRLKLPARADGSDVVLYLRAGDAGDGNEQDEVVWERPRLVVPGRPDLLLRDVRPVMGRLVGLRGRFGANAAKCLEAAAESNASLGPSDMNALARKHGVDADSLAAWLDYLGIATGQEVRLGTLLTRKAESVAGYDFIRRWTGDNALSVVANSSDQHVRIPGNMKPHSVAVHPAPTVSIAVGWRSPAAAKLHITGVVQHAHAECGNGVEWSFELRRGVTRLRLAGGTSQGGNEISFGPLENFAVQPGDVLVLAVSPREGDHACDLTALDLTLQDGTRVWNLARDLSADLLAGNPHPDSHGHADVWHLFSEPIRGSTAGVIPAGSILARWQSAGSTAERQALAEQLQRLLQEGPASRPADSADRILHQQLTSLDGPLLSAARRSIATQPPDAADADSSPFGLDPAQFGRHPGGASVDSASLCVRAPSLLEVRLPADLAAGAEFVTAAALHPALGEEGTVDVQVLTTPPVDRGLSPSVPILAQEGSAARRRREKSFDDFRQLFPAALCYSKIVPVDEVVTVTLFYREDEHLQRLMLDDAQRAQLDRLWDELLYISHEPLLLVDAFLQKYEYASQLGDPKVFEPLRKPIHDRASAFRQRLVATEPRHLDALLEFAGRAFRRPLTDAESRQLRALYDGLRRQEIHHEEAIRLTLARVLVSPAFLYRIEKPGPGAGWHPVSDWELASRLSFFLWSSHPDDELRELAAAGRLADPEVLVAQARRMLGDARTRRLATEFACQWLQFYAFDALNEKSERHFPTFAGLRGAMYEESIQFFTDFFQHNGSVRSILDADHTFLNEDLAQHYGIPDVTGNEWRRVAGVRAFGRGGILAQATTLARQSGASRTSPILRGAWLSEVVLGEKLPRPPKNVPQLADDAPEGLTERQLIERHSREAACASCHARIDPFGYALENYDAIGRFRERDAHGLPINSRTTLPDGTEIDGLDGLRRYLLAERRDSFLRQFNRKLLGYALGRSVQLSDEPLLADMRDALTADGDRVHSAVERIVRSRQFREIRGRDAAPDP